MKQTRVSVGEPEMKAEYDFRGGVRGKYAARYADGTNVLVTIAKRRRPRRTATRAKAAR